MTDRGRETRAGKRKPTINRRRTKDAAIELPKRCEIFLRIVWPTEVKLKPSTKLDEVTKKGEGLHQGNLQHFDHNRYCSDDDSQQHHHHTEQKPHKSGRLFLFGRRLFDDDLRITQRVGEVDWLGLCLVGDCEAVISGRCREDALLRLDLDGLTVKQRSQGHHGRIGQRWQFYEGVDGMRLNAQQLGASLDDATDATLGAALRVAGT